VANLLLGLPRPDGFSRDGGHFVLLATAFAATETGDCRSFFSFSRLLALVAKATSGSKFFAPLLRTLTLLPANCKQTC